MHKLTFLLLFFSLGYATYGQETISPNDTCYEKEYAYKHWDNKKVIELELSIDSIRLGHDLYILDYDSSFYLGTQPKTIHLNDLMCMKFRKTIIMEEGLPVNHIRYSVYIKNKDCWEVLVSSNYSPFGSSGQLGEVTTRAGKGIVYFEGYYWTIQRVD
ncbi:MAG: hypothetical protein JXR19_03605 [Bacteroidia bacterium]